MYNSSEQKSNISDGNGPVPLNFMGQEEGLLFTLKVDCTEKWKDYLKYCEGSLTNPPGTSKFLRGVAVFLIEIA